MKKTLLITKKSGRLLNLFFQTSLNQNEKTTLVEDDKSFAQDIKVVEELNSFFSNVVKNLKFREYSETNPSAEEKANPILKSVLKYGKQIVLLQLETKTSYLTSSFLLSTLSRYLKRLKNLILS